MSDSPTIVCHNPSQLLFIWDYTMIVLYQPQCVGTQMNYNSTTAMHQDDPTTGATLASE